MRRTVEQKYCTWNWYSKILNQLFSTGEEFHHFWGEIVFLVFLVINLKLERNTLGEEYEVPKTTKGECIQKGWEPLNSNQREKWFLTRRKKKLRKYEMLNVTSLYLYYFSYWLEESFSNWRSWRLYNIRHRLIVSNFCFKNDSVLQKSD